MRHFDESFWWDILMRHLMRYYYETFWIYILIRHFDDMLWWDILMTWYCWKFVNNMSRLIMQLLNCTTGLLNLTQRVWHWLPLPCLFINWVSRKSRTRRARELKFWVNVQPPQHFTCHMLHVMCHVSCAMFHMSYVTFFGGWGGTKWWSLSVEGLLTTGHTPSSFIAKLQIKPK